MFHKINRINIPSQITYTIAAGPWGSNNSTTFRVNGSTGDGETNGAQLIMYEVSG